MYSGKSKKSKLSRAKSRPHNADPRAIDGEDPMALSETDVVQTMETAAASEQEMTVPFTMTDNLKLVRKGTPPFFKKYNYVNKKTNFPKHLRPIDDAIYIFEGEAHDISELTSSSMDGQIWTSTTPGGSNHNVEIVCLTFKGGTKYKRIEGVHKKIFHHLAADQYLVLYENKLAPAEAPAPTEIDGGLEAMEVEVVHSAMAVPYTKFKQVLTPDQVSTAFAVATKNQLEREKNNDKTIGNAEPGQLFIFDIDHWGMSWNKAVGMDSYQWKKTFSNDKDPKATFKHTISKVLSWDEKKSKLCQSSSFQKHTYKDQHRNIGMIHYTGSLADVKRGPHGNSKSEAPYICTSPIVRERIAEYGLNKQLKQILDEQN